MEIAINDDLLIEISYDEIDSKDIQVMAYAFDSIQYDKSGCIALQNHNAGTVKLHKLPNGKKCIAMYGVLPQFFEGYEEFSSTSEHHIKYFVECLNKISKAKNLKSIAFSKDTFSNEKYMNALREFSENVEALVYVYGKKAEKVTVIHKSFGDLLGQIKLWKKEKAGWDIFFQARIADKTIATLNAFLQKEVEQYYIYPAPEEIFNAMILCKVSDIKVIIIGQNPYYVPNAAMGLAFSHKDDYGKIQPSLRNIYKELVDCGYKANKTGDLSRWSQKGVFLINTGLTVRQGQADSHMKEWESFTSHLFTFLDKEVKHAVIIMWGSPAQKYSKFFDDKKHKKIMSSHPCPMSARISFFGSKPFIKCNEQLKVWGLKEIDWNLV